MKYIYQKTYSRNDKSHGLSQMYLDEGINISNKAPNSVFISC